MNLTLKQINVYAISILLTLSGVAKMPDDFEFYSIGLRVGTATEGQDVENLEIVSEWNTPWHLQINDSIDLNIFIEASGGILNGSTTTEGIFTVRSGIRVSHDAIPLSLVLSSGPSVLTGHTFDAFDLGGNFQFTTGIGLDLDLSANLRLAYRFQHTSNAGIYDFNPGLDAHTLSFMYLF